MYIELIVYININIKVLSGALNFFTGNSDLSSGMPIRYFVKNIKGLILS